MGFRSPSTLAANRSTQRQPATADFGATHAVSTTSAACSLPWPSRVLPRQRSWGFWAPPGVFPSANRSPSPAPFLLGIDSASARKHLLHPPSRICSSRKSVTADIAAGVRSPLGVLVSFRVSSPTRCRSRLLPFPTAAISDRCRSRPSPSPTDLPRPFNAALRSLGRSLESYLTTPWSSKSTGLVTRHTVPCVVPHEVLCLASLPRTMTHPEG
jgi:hypothetical protein